MKRIINIEGMICGHCKASVERALNAIPGVRAEVFLNSKMAEVELSKIVEDAALSQAIEGAGYVVTSIK